MAGPLHGVRVLELPAIGPVPLLGMLLADLGADVIRVDKLAGDGMFDALPAGPLGRGGVFTAGRTARIVTNAAMNAELPRTSTASGVEPPRA